jgi:hypothetical protein
VNTAPAGTVVVTFAVLPSGVSGWFSDDAGVWRRWVDLAQLNGPARRLTELVIDERAAPDAVRAAALHARGEGDYERQ